VLQGDLAGATTLFRQSLKLRQEIGDKSGQAGSGLVQVETADTRAKPNGTRWQ